MSTTKASTMTTTTPNVLDAALDALQKTASTLTPADHARPTPCSEWTVGQVLEHAALDQQAWASALGAAAGPARDPFHPLGTPAGRVDDLVADAVAAARATWATLSGGYAGRATVPTPLPQGALPADDARAACALDAAVHAWDVSVAVGAPSPLTDTAAASMLDTARRIVEPLRAYGAYAAALADDGADGAAASLLRYLGRDPHWTR